MEACDTQWAEMIKNEPRYIPSISPHEIYKMGWRDALKRLQDNDVVFNTIQETKQSIKEIGHGLRTLEKDVEGIQSFLEKERTIDRSKT